MQNKKRIDIYLLLGIILIGCFLIWTLIVKFIDVKPLGQEGTNIGLYTFNYAFFNYIGVNDTAGKISDILFYPTLATTLIFGVMGLIQLIKRKSFLKVDKQLYILLIGYASATLIYILFELIIVNYRPILIEGELEPSYPSSHTMASIFFLLAGSYTLRYYLKDKKTLYSNITTIVTYILLAVIVILRFVSGLHWCSDIIGGLILAIGLYFLFVYFFNLVSKKEENI